MKVNILKTIGNSVLVTVCIIGITYAATATVSKITQPVVPTSNTWSAAVEQKMNNITVTGVRGSLCIPITNEADCMKTIKTYWLPDSWMTVKNGNHFWKLNQEGSAYRITDVTCSPGYMPIVGASLDGSSCSPNSATVIVTYATDFPYFCYR